METKNKKIIITIAGVAAGLGIIGTMLYGPINMAENEHTNIVSRIASVQSNLSIERDEIIELQNVMNKSEISKKGKINVENIIGQIEREDYLNDNKINEHIEQIDILNQEVDKIINIYNQDEDLKKNITVSGKIMNLEGFNRMLDSTIEEHNMEMAPEFNKSIEKFPVNIVTEKKGWYKVNMFNS